MACAGQFKITFDGKPVDSIDPATGWVSPTLWSQLDDADRAKLWEVTQEMLKMNNMASESQVAELVDTQNKEKNIKLLAKDANSNIEYMVNTFNDVIEMKNKQYDILKVQYEDLRSKFNEQGEKCEALTKVNIELTMKYEELLTGLRSKYDDKCQKCEELMKMNIDLTTKYEELLTRATPTSSEK